MIHVWAAGLATQRLLGRGAGRDPQGLPFPITACTLSRASDYFLMGEPQPQPQHSRRFPRADSERLVPGDPEPCFPASELRASGPLSLVPTVHAVASWE